MCELHRPVPLLITLKPANQHTLPSRLAHLTCRASCSVILTTSDSCSRSAGICKQFQKGARRCYCTDALLTGTVNKLANHNSQPRSSAVVMDRPLPSSACIATAATPPHTVPNVPQSQPFGTPWESTAAHQALCCVESVFRTFLRCAYVSADTSRLPCSAARASCSCSRTLGAAASTCKGHNT